MPDPTSELERPSEELSPHDMDISFLAGMGHPDLVTEYQLRCSRLEGLEKELAIMKDSYQACKEKVEKESRPLVGNWFASEELLPLGHRIRRSSRSSVPLPKLYHDGKELLYVGGGQNRLVYALDEKRVIKISDIKGNVLTEPIAYRLLADVSREALGVVAQPLQWGSVTVHLQSAGEEKKYYYALSERVEPEPPSGWNRDKLEERFNPVYLVLGKGDMGVGNITDAMGNIGTRNGWPVLLDYDYWKPRELERGELESVRDLFAGLELASKTDNPAVRALMLLQLGEERRPIYAAFLKRIESGELASIDEVIEKVQYLISNREKDSEVVNAAEVLARLRGLKEGNLSQALGSRDQIEGLDLANTRTGISVQREQAQAKKEKEKTVAEAERQGRIEEKLKEARETLDLLQGMAAFLPKSEFKTELLRKGDPYLQGYLEVLEKEIRSASDPRENLIMRETHLDWFFKGRPRSIEMAADALLAKIEAEYPEIYQQFVGEDSSANEQRRRS